MLRPSYSNPLTVCYCFLLFNPSIRMGTIMPAQLALFKKGLNFQIYIDVSVNSYEAYEEMRQSVVMSGQIFHCVRSKSVLQHHLYLYFRVSVNDKSCSVNMYSIYRFLQRISLAFLICLRINRWLGRIVLQCPQYTIHVRTFYTVQFEYLMCLERITPAVPTCV